MSDMTELVRLATRLEQLLRQFGAIDQTGQCHDRQRDELIDALQDRLDGLIDNPTELSGLLTICRAARSGKPLSPAVLSAACVMTEVVCEALADPEYPSSATLQ